MDKLGYVCVTLIALSIPFLLFFPWPYFINIGGANFVHIKYDLVWPLFILVFIYYAYYIFSILSNASDFIYSHICSCNHDQRYKVTYNYPRSSWQKVDDESLLKRRVAILNNMEDIYRFKEEMEIRLIIMFPEFIYSTIVTLVILLHYKRFNYVTLVYSSAATIPTIFEIFIAIWYNNEIEQLENSHKVDLNVSVKFLGVKVDYKYIIPLLSSGLTFILKNFVLG